MAEVTLPPCYRCKQQPCECADGITLYHSDCREILPRLGPVDLVLTDPPWKASSGTRSINRAGQRTGVAICHVDKNSIAYGEIGLFDPFVIAECARLARADILIQCGYMELVEVLAAAGKVRGVFAWHNTRPTPIPGPVARRDISFIVWAGQTTSIDGKPWPSCLFSYPSPQGGCMAVERIKTAAGSTAHPAQEPIALYHALLAPLAGVVLDPYGGTGTTGRACKELGRKCIMVEIEQKYCDIIVERLRQEVLF